MIRRLLLITLALFLASFPLKSANAASIASTRIFYSTGKKSQTSGIEDRDVGGYFSYYKYGAVIKAEPTEDFYYRVSYEDYHKNFDAKRDSLDNRTNIYKTYFSIPLRKTDKTMLAINADYRLRTKRYKNSPSSEYDNNNASAGLEFDFNNYSLELWGGIKDYDYLKSSSSDQLKSFLKITPKIDLFEKDLILSGYYKHDRVDQADNKKDYTENSYSIRSILKLDTPILNKLNGHFDYGRNDTRDDEEDREDNLRFVYNLWDITGYLKLHKPINTQLTYGQIDRKYLTSANSYTNWYIKDKTKIKIFKKDSLSLNMLIDYEHKESRYHENEALSYRKNTLLGGFNITERGNYSVKPSFKFTRYDYEPGSTSNQKAYKANISARKYLGSTDKALAAGYWYEWKDYKYRPDENRWSLNLSFKLQF